MTAAEYQRTVRLALEKSFPDRVRDEWSVAKEATDRMTRDVKRYAPRVDVAVGPFSITPGREDEIASELLPDMMRARLVGRQPNPNPRCLLAIEIVFSGSSKHIMGDILNAGALGLYGIVIGRQDVMAKIDRIGEYLQVLAELKKLPALSRNVLLISVEDFNEVLGSLPA